MRINFISCILLDLLDKKGNTMKNTKQRLTKALSNKLLHNPDYNRLMYAKEYEIEFRIQRDSYSLSPEESQKIREENLLRQNPNLKKLLG